MARIAPLPPDGWNGILPARYGWPGIGHVPLRTARNALPRAARMLPQARAERCTFSRKTDLNQTADAATPSPDTLLRIIAAQAEISKLGLDLGSVMAYVAEQVPQLTGASAAAVEFAEGDDMVYRAASGTAAGMLGLRLRRSGSLSGLCVQQGELLHCIDSETDPRVDRDACRRVGLRSMLVMPLTHADTTVGVLKVMSPDVDGFSPTDAGTLRLMADLIAAAMFHAARNEANELYLRATHDALTGLPNRALFYDRLRQSMHTALRASGRLGILNIDMDGLKPINDGFGHRAGDAALREVATRMQAAVRRSDTVARIGGDEFAVILPNLGTRDDAQVQSMRLARRVGEPFEFDGHALRLGVSVGIAMLPDDGTDMNALIEHADQAMYEAKRSRSRRTTHA
ncbi:sensor domain-containing diguanylate cyclase [Burkholderia cenocepacia]|uniref:sensor domain-containing diguanylate cyclase n=1 Tax=Burkholderia cenocepacia TaxID=95486 RepID=UPI002B24CC28|nr:sensor domain-containing diguanylate cyclase [Burkholderia cenocepacia]MEB2605921.1 sensor domain-containing diguanylate cyclase [Burkholderia cenocepacia]